MFHKRNVMNRLAAFAVALGVGVLFGGAAGAQQFRMNVGCPTLGSADIGKYTVDELNALCHNTSGGSSSSSGGTQVAAAENGASLSCDQHRALAAFARMNPGFVEGQTSQAIVNKYCGGESDGDAPPQGSQVGGNLLNGVFRFDRGYFTKHEGEKAEICKPHYWGDAYISNGQIQFASGGFTWRGTISNNSFISITRAGVFPPLKHPTSISGPMLDAELYNGYCGYGYFRLSGRG